MPDPAAWALWGEDLEARGLVPVAAPAAAGTLLVPATIPAGLEDAVRGAWEELPPPRRLVELPGPALPGQPAAEALGPEEDAARGSKADDEHGDEHGDGDEHGEHDHGDMMEITGEPSRDGLVMESIEHEHGPLAPGLPGGLVIAAELDGDVVASCEIRASLRATASDGSALGAIAPDPLAAVAWSVALGRATGVLGARSTRAVVALEWERSVSHLLWLESFAAIIGWDDLGRRAALAARPLIGAGPPIVGPVDAEGQPGYGDGVSPSSLTRAHEATAKLCRFLANSRRLASRSRGHAVVSAEDAERRGLSGPGARASGLAFDARAGDPVYEGLGFQVRTGVSGDAEARVLQRAGEAHDALELALAALERADSDRVDESSPASACVESPRGPVSAHAPAGREGRPAVFASGGA
ncbi:MAG TPA: hypothetical protein VGR10_07305, partial [Thermoleophilaceae bacterium]|nr:hypothetical protein [Thermoleophilaceae bacterium]